MNGYQILWFGNESPEDSVKRHSATGFQNNSVTNDSAFVQIFAKIAYSFAVGISGVVKREDSPIPDLLRNGTGLGTWVGSGTFELKGEKDGATHALAHNPEVRATDGIAAVVRLKLFAASGAPDGYEVVTHTENWKEYAGN